MKQLYNFLASLLILGMLLQSTKNFRQDCLLGEGGFGHVYEGRLENWQVMLSGTILMLVCKAKSSQIWLELKH
jgi:hypothetical protein